MERGIVEYLSKCLEFQQYKVEQKNPTRMFWPLPIPEWKWKIISMDFITGLPKSSKQNDAIMLVVDKLTRIITLSQ